MGKAARKLSGAALAEFNEKHPKGPDGRFIKKGTTGAPSAPAAPAAPTAGRARARLGLASGVDMSRSIKALSDKRAAPVSGDREAVDELLRPMTHAQLDAVARHFDMDSFVRGTKEAKARQLREGIVGARLDHDAIMRTDLRAHLGGLPTQAEADKAFAQIADINQRGAAAEASGAKPGRARAALAGTAASNPLIQQHQTDLEQRLAALSGDSNGRQQAETMLSALTVPALKELASTLPTVRKGGSTKKQLIGNIVEGTVGFRQRSEGIAPGLAARRAADAPSSAAAPSAPAPSSPPKAGRARAALAGKPDVTSAAVRDGLKAATSTADAEQYLAGLNLSVADLKRIAGELDLPTSGGGKGIRASLVKVFATGRLTTNIFPALARTETPAAPAAPRTPTRAAQRLGSTTPARPATPGRSPNPLLPNTWGGVPDGGSAAVHFHPDGVIGQALRGMGDDQHMEIEGDALGNVLGRIATDTVMGRTSAQDQVARLKTIQAQVPLGSRARRELQLAIEKLDVPEADVPDMPDSSPQPLRQLMKALLAIPAVRREPREIDALKQIASDFDQGQISGLGMIGGVRGLLSKRHESNEGYFDVIRAVQQAMRDLEAQQRSDPASMRRRTPGKA